MGGEFDDHAVVDVGPFGMVIHRLCMDGDFGHETKRFSEGPEPKLSAEPVGLEVPVGVEDPSGRFDLSGLEL